MIPFDLLEAVRDPDACGGEGGGGGERTRHHEGSVRIVRYDRTGHETTQWMTYVRGTGGTIAKGWRS